MALLLPQGGHGVDPGRAGGGDEASHEGGGHEGRWSRSERQGIAGVEAEELGLHEAAEAVAAREADQDPDAREEGHLAEHEEEDVLRSAPRAMRRPISLVRAVTAELVTP